MLMSGWVHCTYRAMTSAIAAPRAASVPCLSTDACPQAAAACSKAAAYSEHHPTKQAASQGGRCDIG
eukprot:82176-Pelagomonas_calceolata.AAC.2